MLENFRFHPHLVMRSPSYHLNITINEESILNHLRDPLFKEALYLASPNLYYKSRSLIENTIKNQKDRKRTILSIANYLNRIRSRCTPFGLFASCSVVKWGPSSKVNLDPTKFNRHTRIDMFYLCKLARQLSNTILKDWLKFLPNSTIYKIGDEIRYVERIYDNANNQLQITSVMSSEAIDFLLESTKEGATIAEMVKFISEDNEDAREEAKYFILEMIQAQLLVSELEPRITGPEYFHQIEKVIKKIYANNGEAELTSMVNVLKNVVNLLRKLDSTTTGNNIAIYKEIIASLETFETGIHQSKMFQTDLCRYASGSISHHVKDQIIEAGNVLQCFSPIGISSHLEKFKRDFYNRYENQEMPITQVLDTEVGIGYAEVGKDGNVPLIEDLLLPGKEMDQRSITRNRADQYLIDKIRAARNANQRAITIQDEEIKPLKRKSKPLTASMAAMFRLIGTGEIFLESISGASAVNLIARFAHGDDQIHSIMNDIVAKEEAQNPDVVFAEIVHLPSDRVGNILLRPTTHKYEIPYLAQSSVEKEYQIPINDILVSVRDGKVQLRIKDTNKIIIPRLSSAHNFSYQAMPIYRFLCDLQGQDHQLGFYINWNPEKYDYHYLPRLSYKKVILAPETWHFKSFEISQLINDGIAGFEAFKKKWQIPEEFILAIGDKELWVNSAEPITVDSFIQQIGKMEDITLKEFIYNAKDSEIKDGANQPYANQFIAFLTKNQPSHTVSFQPSVIKSKIEREFPPGSEWVYFKIYCGVKSADKILVESIKPLANKLLEENLIDQWFFIRFLDPDHHIRVRFHLKEYCSASLGNLTFRVNQQLNPYKKSGHCWKIQLETYQRELERYGTKSMRLAEAIFFYDSLNVLTIIEKLIVNGNENLRWIWGIKAVDNLLTLFDLPFEQKLAIVAELSQNFSDEFNMNKDLKRQMDKKYRNYQSEIMGMMDRQDLNQEIFIANEQIKPIVEELNALVASNELEIPINHLLKSYIHMLLNRLMPAKQRVYELLIYNFLCRQYRSKQARAKQ